MGEGVEYHTLYGVDRTRLTTRISITVLGKDSLYGRIVCGMCCQMSGPERSSRRSDSSSLDCTYKGSSPGQSVEPDTGQEWQPTTHRSHGDSTAIDDLPSIDTHRYNATPTQMKRANDEAERASRNNSKTALARPAAPALRRREKTNREAQKTRNARKAPT
jgi:hypothetical protein